MKSLKIVGTGVCLPSRVLTNAELERMIRPMARYAELHARRRAPDGFDARFSALWRRYVYRVTDAPGVPDPLVRGHVLAWPRTLDEKAMQEAATLLLGEHDFASFCKRREGATTIRTLLDLRVEKVLKLGGALRLSGFLDVFNMFNANPEQNITWSSGTSFLRPSNIVPPRIARFGTKFEW